MASQRMSYKQPPEWAPCKCGCTSVVYGPAVPPHGHKLDCSECESFRGWLAKGRALEFVGMVAPKQGGLFG